MPPQLTNISPGIEGDAARRGLNLSIVQAKSAVDQALAARLKASAVALENALYDKNAAGSATRSAFGLLKQYWITFFQRRGRSQVSLHDLNDRELMDIGLTRGEIDCIAPGRAIDALRDRTRHLLNRGGM